MENKQLRPSQRETLLALATNAERSVYELFAGLDNSGEFPALSQEVAAQLHVLRRIARELARGQAR